MKNNNIFWILAGAGVGALAYFAFCKRQQLETVEVMNEDGEMETKSVPKSGGGGGGGFFAPTPRPITSTLPVAPIPTTINILPTSPVVSSPTTTQPTITTPTTTLTPNTNVTPVTTIPSTPTVTSPVSPSLTTAPTVTVRPTPTVTSPTTDLKPATATSLKTESAFSGMNGEAFEVGRLLNDL